MSILDKVMGGQRAAKGKSSSDLRLIRADAQMQLDGLNEKRPKASLAKVEGAAGGAAELSTIDAQRAELEAVIRDFDSAILAAEARERLEATKDQREAEARRIQRDRELRVQLQREAQEAERALAIAAEKFAIALKTQLELINTDQGKYNAMFQEAHMKFYACVAWQLRGIVKSSSMRPEPYERWSDYLPKPDNDQEKPR